jgi:hypothetical protein
MIAMNPRVKQVEYESPYKLIITFDNDAVRLFDITDYLQYPVYTTLQDETFCRRAKVFNGTVIWDDIIDFDPDTLYIESHELVGV